DQITRMRWCHTNRNCSDEECRFKHYKLSFRFLASGILVRNARRYRNRLERRYLKLYLFRFLILVFALDMAISS
ncbi:MAG: hypothetical protein ABJL73_06610, partial [Lentilitoribacter sp.]